MNKHKLFLSVFILSFILLGFGAQSVSASDSGCLPGDVFSRTTGEVCEVSSRTFTVGSRGSDVRELQLILKNQGYYFGKIDGIYGKKTERAVRNFQDDSDISVTGNADANTVQKLNMETNVSQPANTSISVAPANTNSTNKPSSVAPILSTVSSPYPAGCTSASGFSMTTGNACDGSTPDPTSLIITTSSPLPSAKVGQLYDVVLSVSGYPGSFSNRLYWKVDTGSLPSGLHFSASDEGELLIGTPTKAGVYNFSLRASINSSPSASQTTTKQFSLTVTNQNGCITSDPFVSLGGGACVNGGWVPPGHPLFPAPMPTPVYPPGCTSASGFSSTTGAACDGSAPAPILVPVVPTPAPIFVPVVPVVPVVPTPAPVVNCATPDPFVSLGGGACVNGGWIPPGHPLSPPAGCTSNSGYSSTTGAACDGSTPPTPMPVIVPTPTPTPAPAPVANCATPDPFVSLGGGVCLNGGWLPPGHPLIPR